MIYIYSLHSAVQLGDTPLTIQ